MQNFDALQVWVNIFFQSLGGWLTLPMQAFSLLGSEEFYMLVMPALYWCIDSALGLRLGIILLLSNGFGMIFKLALHSPRPYWVDARVQALSSEPTFGLPSSHALTAVSLWGLAAIKGQRRGLAALCIVVMILIGLSRIYLGVHFASDVLVGWVLGLLLLLAFLALEAPLTMWISRLSLRSLLLVCAASSVLLLLAILLTHAAFRSWQVPPAWVNQALKAAPGAAIDPGNMDNAFTITGTWLGLTAGAAWFSRRKGRWQNSAAPAQLLLRYLVGVVGVLILWYGLGAILPRKADFLSYLLRYVRYTLVGGWISAIAPLTFQRLGLLNLVK